MPPLTILVNRQLSLAGSVRSASSPCLLHSRNSEEQARASVANTPDEIDDFLSRADEHAGATEHEHNVVDWILAQASETSETSDTAAEDNDVTMLQESLTNFIEMRRDFTDLLVHDYSWTGVDNLYAFFVQWSPNLYGGEDEIDAKERGFVVIEDEDEGDEDVQVDFVKGRLIRSMSKDWEILNVAEARRRMSILDVEETLPLPELHGETAILTEEHVSLLTKILPARSEGYPWTLIYSSDQNGFSLATVYRAMQGYDCPILLVIKCTSNHVFGALTSCSIKCSEHFYGTGETFLYTFYPEFKAYSWSGENSYFIKGNKDGLAIGAGTGSFGIWLDGDLYHGRTQHCDTYNNQPLTSQEDFVIKGLEAWGFF